MISGFQILYFWISAFQLTALLDWRDGAKSELVTYGILGVSFMIGYALGGALFSRDVFDGWILWESAAQLFYLCAALHLNRRK